MRKVIKLHRTTAEIHEDIAKRVLQIMQAYSLTIGEIPWPLWDELTPDVRRRLCERVGHVISGDTVEQCHEKWLSTIIREGWMWDHARDHKLKTEPHIVPFEQLPNARKIKDALLHGAILKESLKR